MLESRLGHPKVSPSNRNKFTYVGWSKTMYGFKAINKILNTMQYFAGSQCSYSSRGVMWQNLLFLNTRRACCNLCNLWRLHSGILLSKRLEQASQKTKLLRHNITFFLEVFGNIHYLSKSLFRSLYMLKYIHIVFSMITFLLAFFFITEHYWNASFCFHWDIQSQFYCSVVKEEQTLLDSVTRNTNH